MRQGPAGIYAPIGGPVEVREGERVITTFSNDRDASKFAQGYNHAYWAREREVSKLEDLIATFWLYTGRYEETQLTTEQKELFADVVEKRTNDRDFQFDRWWR